MSKDLAKYYSIHNLINIKVNTKKRFFGNNVLNNPLSFFETNEEINPDIIINLGKFEPKKKNNHLVDHKYHIDQDYLYFKDKGRSAEWEVEINGLENLPIIINFDGKIFGINKYLVPDVLYYETILKPLMEIVLGFNGYFLAHAGALSKNNESMLFFGLPGSLKSTIILNGIKKGYKTLGDDKIIVDLNSKNIYCFPVYQKLFEYTLGIGKEELTFLQKFKFIFYSNNKSYSYIWDNSHRRLNKVFILKIVDKTKFSINKVDIENVIKYLIANNKEEMFNSSFSSIIGKNNFNNILLAFSYVFPNCIISNYWNIIKKNLRDNLKNVNFIEIQIPRKYNQSTIEDIFELIGDYY